MECATLSSPFLSSQLPTERINSSQKSQFLGAKCLKLHPVKNAIHKKGLKIEMAISRQKKETTVEKTKKELEDCKLLASIKYKDLTVKQVQELRKRLPEGSKLVVMKNNLLEKAVEGTPYEAIKPSLTGMNAFLFVHSEEIPVALKPFRDMQKELKLESNDYTGAVFEGKFYGPADFNALETMPSRAELYAKLLGNLKAPSTNLVSTIQGPARNLVFTLKAFVQKLEEQEKA